MPQPHPGHRYVVTAQNVADEQLAIAYHATITHASGGQPRTALVLPEQRHRVVRQYGHEDGWKVEFTALIELPDELLLSWAYHRVRECVSKDKQQEFDEIALRAIMNQQIADQEEK